MKNLLSCRIDYNELHELSLKLALSVLCRKYPKTKKLKNILAGPSDVAEQRGRAKFAKRIEII